MRLFLLPFSLLTLSLLLTSCSETKVSRCNSLIQVANRTTQDIQSLPAQAIPPKERFAKAAELLDRAARDVTDLKVNDATLKPLRDQMIELYSRDRDSNRLLATSENAKEIRQAAESIQKNDVIQKNLVKAANTYCQAPEKS